MADQATTTYNLEQAKAQMERCEALWHQLFAMATATLTEMAHLRSMLAALAQAVGVDVAPAAAAPPAAPAVPAPSAPPSQEASPSGSRGRSSSPRSGEKA